MTFSFKHESRNGEWTALPGRRASVEGELGARRIGQHHGKRHCHVSLECLRGTVPLIDLIVLQGHLCPIGSSSSLGSPPRECREGRIREKRVSDLRGVLNLYELSADNRSVVGESEGHDREFMKDTSRQIR